MKFEHKTSFFWIRSKSLGRILHFTKPPPNTFLIFWAAELVDRLSLPITGFAAIPGLYPTQRFQWMKESSGHGIFPADYPSQSVDRIARQDDIYSRNRKNFWVAERFQKLYSPIASSADLSQVFFPVHRMIFASHYYYSTKKRRWWLFMRRVLLTAQGLSLFLQGYFATASNFFVQSF